MKIIIDKKGELESAKYTIDLSEINYPYAIRNAIEIALQLDGKSDGEIYDIFGRSEVCEPDKEWIDRNVSSTQELTNPAGKMYEVAGCSIP